MTSMKKQLFGYFFFGLVLVCLDRFLKLWALSACVDPLSLMPCVRCELAFNRGVAFGMFYSAGSLWFWLLTAGILMVVGIMSWLAIQRVRLGLPVLGHVLIIAGALGNTIDRFVQGAVIDFILVFYKDWHFPIFNGADVCIVCGVMLLFWYEMRPHA